MATKKKAAVKKTAIKKKAAPKKAAVKKKAAPKKKVMPTGRQVAVKKKAAPKKAAAKKGTAIKKTTVAKKTATPKKSIVVKKKAMPVGSLAAVKKTVPTAKKVVPKKVAAKKAGPAISAKQKQIIEKDVAALIDAPVIPIQTTIPYPEKNITKGAPGILRRVKKLATVRNHDPHHISLNKVKKGGPKPSGKKPLW